MLSIQTRWLTCSLKDEAVILRCLCHWGPSVCRMSDSIFRRKEYYLLCRHLVQRYWASLIVLYECPWAEYVRGSYLSFRVAGESLPDVERSQRQPLHHIAGDNSSQGSRRRLHRQAADGLCSGPKSPILANWTWWRFPSRKVCDEPITQSSCRWLTTMGAHNQRVER